MTKKRNLFRLAEIKGDVIGNYKHTMAKYSKNGNFVIPIEDEGSDEAQEIHLRDQILEVISEEEPQVCFT